MFETVKQLKVIRNKDKVSGIELIGDSKDKFKELQKHIESIFVAKNHNFRDFTGLYFQIIRGKIYLKISYNPNIEIPDKANQLINQVEIIEKYK